MTKPVYEKSATKSLLTYSPKNCIIIVKYESEVYMNKQFNRYFGKNILSKIYAVGIALVAVGVVVSLAYSAFFGVPIAAIGVLLFFVTSAFKVSDGDIDALVAKYAEEYGEKNIDGKTIGKKTLEAKDFSVFCGFYADPKNTRFKSGRDGKVRTSKFFITAISASKGEAHVFSSLYDILDEGKESKSELHISQNDEIELKKVNLEFPHGVFAIELNANGESGSRTVNFYLPDDALADQLVDKISKL